MVLAVQSEIAVRRQPELKWPLRATILIVNYNTRENLVRCLDSLLRSAPPDCEVIVVDNGSIDSSAQAVEAEFPEVTVICSTNVGFGAGNNIGARQAHGSYLVFLNPDTTVEDGFIEALLAPFEEDDRAGLVTSKVVMANEPDRINACGNAVHFTGLTLCRGLGLPREAFSQPGEVDAVSGAAFAIRRELFDSLGGFDEDTFLYMEDTDLSWRARLSGWRCMYAPDSIVLHDYSLRITPLKVFYQERNRYLMLLKNLRWPTLAVLLPSLFLAELITWSFVLLRDHGNLGNKLRAYRWIVANRRAISRKRKQTQSLRRVSDRHLLKHTTYELDFGQVSGRAVTSVARLVFNPVFFVLRSVTMLLVWW